MADPSMWTQCLIRSALQASDAHDRLMERRCTRIHNDRMWINGYEFGLFMTPNDATVMGETMHIRGFILEDVVSAFMHELALTYGHAENVLCMQRLVWNVQVLRGILKRPDAHILLLNEYGVNGYEYAMLHDEHMCKMIGCIIQKHRLQISDVIRFSVFRQSFPENIKALFYY